jgi:ribosome biogenesis GTPase
MRARELGRRGVVVGDRVSLVGDTSDAEDALARIVRVAPRRSVLRRSADDTDPVERVIVANADQLVIVTSLAEPPPRPRLIDRCLVAAYDAHIDALLCLTKADLASPDELLAAYEPLHVPAIAVSRTMSVGIDELRAALTGRTSVLVGHSGVGKSTLVNRLLPDARRATGAVNVTTGRGRHTSSSAVAFPFAGSGWLIDTPGVRSFGLAHVRPETVVAAFPDLAPGIAGCPSNCPHTAGAPQCALDAWVAEGNADPARLDSLRRLLASRTTTD